MDEFTFDIGANQIVGVIASSSTQYLQVYSPIFLFIGGIILAVIILEILASFIPDRTPTTFDMDAFNVKADELKEFYSKNGRSGARYDFDNIRDKV